MTDSTSPPPHQLGDDVGLAVLLPEVEDGDDVGVCAETAHGLGLPGNPGAGGLVQTLGLDQGEGDFPVQGAVMGQVDELLAALAQELL